MAKQPGAVLEPPAQHPHPHQHPHHEEPQEPKAAVKQEEHPAPTPAKAPPPAAAGAGAKLTPALLGVPPLLGKAPTALSQILANLGDRGTHHFGPLITGGSPSFTPAAAPPVTMVRKVAGSALAACFVQIDYTMGDFTLPMLFPTDSILLWAIPQVFTPFTGGTGDTKFQLGRTSGGAEILAATAMGLLHAFALAPMISTLPTYSDAPGMTPFQAYLHIAQTGNTAGQGIVAFIFARGFQKWT
jgi:hypothetical protein